MPLFDPDTFLNESAGGPLSTERTLIPPGTYGNCYIEDIKPSEGTISKGEREGQPWVRMGFVFVIDDPELRSTLDRAVVKLTYGIMLDLTPTGELDMGRGKNIRLGRLRQALGINSGPVLWREFMGIPCTLQVGHGVNGKDGTPTEEVLAVAGH